MKKIGVIGLVGAKLDQPPKKLEDMPTGRLDRGSL